MITKEQYELLVENESHLECASKQGFARNLDRGWLNRAKDVYQEHTGSPLNIDCNQCVIPGMSRLYDLMIDYRESTKKKD